VASDQLEKWQSKFDTLFPDGLAICVGDPAVETIHPAPRAHVVGIKGLIPTVAVQAFFADKEFLFDVVAFEEIQTSPVKMYKVSTSDKQDVYLSDGITAELAAEMKAAGA
jgi:hypothetical protein